MDIEALGHNQPSLLKMYFHDIGRCRQLRADEEQELVCRAHTGDAMARKLLIQSKLLLVVNIARQYAQNEADMLDLIQEGNIGLIQAVDRFDPQQGTRLSTLAVFWIKKQIQHYLDNTADEMVSLDIELDNQRERLFLSDVIEDQATLLGDQTIESVDTKIEREERQRRISSMLGTLEERERLVLQMLYGLEGYPSMSRKELAKAMDVSEQYISRIKIRALERLRDASWRR